MLPEHSLRSLKGAKRAFELGDDGVRLSLTKLIGMNSAELAQRFRDRFGHPFSVLYIERGGEVQIQVQDLDNKNLWYLGLEELEHATDYARRIIERVESRLQHGSTDNST